MTEEIFAKIVELLAQTKGVDPATITMDMTFDQLGMDSLDSLDLVSELEEAYNVTIPNQEVLKIKTVRQAVESLEKVLNP